MKQLKLIIPEYKEDAIDLSQIDVEFKGIIIAIKDNQAIGTIIFDDSSWCLINSITLEDYTYAEYSLVDLILKLLKANVCDSFTVIKFE